MTEMHSFLTAKQMEIPSPKGETKQSVRDLLEFLCQVCEWIQMTPFTYWHRSAELNTVYLWFNDVVFPEDDFWQVFGAYLTALRTRWKIDIFGTSSLSQETVLLTLREENQSVYAVQKTLSGQPVDTLQSLCLKMECISSEQAEFLSASAAAINWKNGTIVLDWKYGTFLSEENLTITAWNSCFCYGSVFEDTDYEDILQTLNFEQKIILWTGFLKDGFDYLEFEWLYQTICQDIVPNRIEWELSLHTAMQNLEYTIQISPTDFELRDGHGCRRYFNFNSTSYAERAFLKMIFPLNI